MAPDDLAPREETERPAEREPTLDAVLTESALAELPDRLALLLQLAWPLAAHFAWLGWWAPAAGAVTAGGYGLWAWCERQLRAGAWERGETLRVVRNVSGAVAAIAGFVALLAAFFRLLGDAPIS